MLNGRRLLERVVTASALSALPENMPPLLRRIYAGRLAGVREIETTLTNLLPISQLDGTEAAAECLYAAFRAQQKVVVVGDFDADGATATALVIYCLRGFGFGRVGYRVPDRFRFGYGLSVGIVEELVHDAPDLIITVDNGISSQAGVAAANRLGMDVIITDHHLPGAELPAAAAIVNPSLADNGFASKSLAGVGVAFYVMAALGQRLAAAGAINAGDARRICAACLDLVALGTVADLVLMDHNNRVLVAQGLQRIRGGSARPGIAALFAAAGRNIAMATTADLGFAIAPRLNAAGRLENMSLGIECLIAPTMAAAQPLAALLSRLNTERQQLQADMQREADQHVATIVADLAVNRPAAVCLFDAGWHQGIVGLVASRIKESVNRPVIAFAHGEDEGLLKGSGRSVNGVHLRDLLATIDSRHPGLIHRFGGHAMAAGLTIEFSALPFFRAALATAAEAHVAAIGNDMEIMTDGSLESHELCLEQAELLRFAGPWGQGFPEPLFHGRFVLLEQRIVGESHLRLRLRPVGAGPMLAGIAFNCEPLPVQRELSECRVVYRLDVNDYLGRRSLQLVVEHIECD